MGAWICVLSAAASRGLGRGPTPPGPGPFPSELEGRGSRFLSPSVPQSPLSPRPHVHSAPACLWPPRPGQGCSPPTVCVGLGSSCCPTWWHLVSLGRAPPALLEAGHTSKEPAGLCSGQGLGAGAGEVTRSWGAQAHTGSGTQGRGNGGVCWGAREPWRPFGLTQAPRELLWVPKAARPGAGRPEALPAAPLTAVPEQDLGWS